MAWHQMGTRISWRHNWMLLSVWATDVLVEELGPWFNVKIPSYQYRKSHCGDKTVVRSSYLHNGIFYTGKMASLYWIRAPVFSIHNTDSVPKLCTQPIKQKWLLLMTACPGCNIPFDEEWPSCLRVNPGVGVTILKLSSLILRKQNFRSCRSTS